MLIKIIIAILLLLLLLLLLSLFSRGGLRRQLARSSVGTKPCVFARRTPNLCTKTLPAKIRRLELSGKLPVDVRISLGSAGAQGAGSHDAQPALQPRSIFSGWMKSALRPDSSTYSVVKDVFDFDEALELMLSLFTVIVLRSHPG